MTDSGRTGLQTRDGVAPPSEALRALWTAVAEVIGSAATAVLIRRAIKRAARQYPSLDDLTVELQEFLYQLRIPEHWDAPPDAETAEAIRALIAAFTEIARQLSGEILIRHISRLAVLEPYRGKDKEE